MRKAVVGVLLALSIAAIPTTAAAQGFPQNFPVPAIPTIPTSPNPSAPSTLPTDLGQWLRNATNGATNGGASANSNCPPIEIAPGILLPVCTSGLPQPPPGVIIPETLLTPPAFLAPSVDLRAQGLDGPIKSQEQTGVCYAFALTTALEGSLRRQGRPDVLSPLHVVAAGTWYELWGSSRPTEAITFETSWPYDPIKACKFERGHDSCEESYGVRAGSWQSEPQLVAERESAKTRGVAWAGKASKIKGSDKVQGALNGIATGRVLYAEIGIDSRAWGFRGIHNGVLEEYETADRGPHAVALVGYRTVAGGRQYLIHNSWGKSWGEGGYAWMTEAGLRKHLQNVWLVDATASQGGAMPMPVPPIPIPTFPTNPNQNQSSNPSPNPSTRPATTSCASGTAIDVGTGRCAALCRSGLAPFMGQCVFG